MKQLLQIFTVVLAFLWVPITSHCAWENIPGLEFFKCAEGAPQNSQKASHDSPKKDCADDACSTLEGGSYKVSETQMTVPAPVLTVLIQFSLFELTPVEQPSPVTAAPLEIPSGWQFSFRTALAPRAPSLS